MYKCIHPWADVHTQHLLIPVIPKICENRKQTQDQVCGIIFYSRPLIENVFPPTIVFPSVERLFIL